MFLYSGHHPVLPVFYDLVSILQEEVAKSTLPCSAKMTNDTGRK